MNALPKYLKVLSDGTRVPADDPRTDHVAVLDVEHNLLLYVNSVGKDGKKIKPKDAQAAVDLIDALGGGWLAADRTQAQLFLDLTKYGPAFDSNLFPGLKADWHVTTTPAAWAPARAAWWVNFVGGGVFGGNLNYDGFALAVRPAGQ